MGRGVRIVGGSTLPTGQKQGAPRPGQGAEEESMPTGIRELVLGWGGESEPHDDAERLAALLRGILKA